MTITAGENVGPYRIIEQLGSGGMATVFKAYHAALDRYVAIKVLHTAFKADPQFFERFQREARIVARLEHPHIIPVYDFNEHHGEPYLVMRFVEGDTLKHKMDDGPLPAYDILHYMGPVCRALTYAHQQGVLHRDIKPSNIMLTNEGHIFLTDFGLARIAQAGESTLSQDMLVGTPQYISPEQAQGMKELDGRTDIYSLGVVLYEMFTGRAPFSADTPFATIHDHIYSPLPLPSKINPTIDPAVERLLLKALAKDPNDRFATAAELWQALETTLSSNALPQPRPDQVSRATPTAVKPPSMGKPWWVYVGGAALVICVVAALLAGLWLWRRARLAPPAPNQPLPAQAADTGRPGHPPTAPADQAAPPPTSQPQNPAANSQAAQLTRQATAALEQKQWDQAVELYRQAIAADPHHLPAYFGQSLALRQKGDIPGSMAVLEEAVAQNPTIPEAYLRLGEAQLTGDNAEAALQSFDQAINLEADSPGAYARKAMALLKLNRNEEAKAAIDTALSLDQLNPEARLANAMYLIKQGERRKALVELQQLAQDRRAPLFVVQRAKEFLAQLKN